VPVSIVGGDLFSSKAQTLVCTVNTVGVMGAGVAKEFKARYPDMFQAYKRACRDYFFMKHRNFIYDDVSGVKILCMPTKQHWRFPSKVEWVRTALKDIAAKYEEYGITSMAMPPPGCGNGGLLWWEEVEPVVRKILDPLPIEITVYIPPYWVH